MEGCLGPVLAFPLHSMRLERKSDTFFFFLVKFASLTCYLQPKKILIKLKKKSLSLN